MEKPELSKFMNAETFSSYYYLKEELVAFCKELGLPTSGNKQELSLIHISIHLFDATSTRSHYCSHGKSNNLLAI